MKNSRNTFGYIFCLFALSFALIFICCILIVFSRHFHKSDTDALSEVHSSATVILDAGHGGFDSGANVGTVYEKSLNLAIVEKIKNVLSLYDVNVVLTRNDDKALAETKRDDLLNRVKTANQYDDALFVSVHMNKFPIEKYCGLQVFYSRNSSFSEALALKIQSNNQEMLENDNRRTVTKSNSSIYILDRLQCPAVLIECGFLSNYADFVKLTNDEYQNKLAFVIANSIIEYLGL